MSGVTKAEHPSKETFLVGIIVNSNNITTTLTCANFYSYTRSLFENAFGRQGRGGYDPSNMLVKKLTKLEERIDALSNV